MAFGVWAWVMTHPKLYLALGRLGSMLAPLMPNVGLLRSWASEREVPRLASRSFHRWWAERAK